MKWWAWWVVGWLIRWWREYRKVKLQYGICPFCGHEFAWGIDGFECLESGHYTPPGDYTVYWFRGVQTCPRCRHRWEYEDGS